MPDAELDQIYGELCRQLTAVGARRAELFLARFALLASLKIDACDEVLRLIAEAAADLRPSDP
jgi:hypothetical protein